MTTGHVNEAAHGDKPTNKKACNNNVFVSCCLYFQTLTVTQFGTGERLMLANALEETTVEEYRTHPL